MLTLCINFLTTEALSLGHDILKTVCPGHGIIESITKTITWKSMELYFIFFLIKKLSGMTIYVSFP